LFPILILVSAFLSFLLSFPSAVVDLAAMRNAMARLGGNPEKINPLVPADLVVDHSVQVDYARDPDALAKNLNKEMERNAERFQFLKWSAANAERWGQSDRLSVAFDHTHRAHCFSLLLLLFPPLLFFIYLTLQGQPVFLQLPDRSPRIRNRAPGEPGVPGARCVQREERAVP